MEKGLEFRGREEEKDKYSEIKKELTEGKSF